MKVKILMNKVSWDISKELKAVKKWFSKHVKLDFEIVGKGYINVGWTGSKQNLKAWWVKNEIFDDSATIYVLNLPKYQWEADHLGFAPQLESNGQKIIAMTSGVNGRRRLNKGWMNDNEFAGRLRHELCHTFYQLTKSKDKLHVLEQDNISLALKDIKWENLKS